MLLNDGQHDRRPSRPRHVRGRWFISIRLPPNPLPLANRHVRDTDLNVRLRYMAVVIGTSRARGKHSVNPSSAAGHGRGWSGNCFSDGWLGGWGLSEAPGQAR